MKHVALSLCLLVFGCTLTGDKNQCATQADCLDGFTCSAAGTCERGTSTCTPITCDGRCGTLDDHCQGTISCGDCPEHCTNSAQDPSETDIDCGGDCAPCVTGQHCALTSDCQTGTCDAGTCRSGTWTTVAPMPTPRTELAAVVGADGRIYTIGGRSSGGASGVVEVYDPSTNSWTTRAPMPTPRYGLAAVLGSDNRVYAIGGNYTSVSDAGASVVAEVYNPMTNAWQSLPSLSIGRDNVAAAADASGKIYALGGYDGTTVTTLGSVATFQPGAASWSSLGDAMTTARSMHASAVMPDGKIYALGGERSVASSELDAFEYYQPGTAGWYTLAPMPTSRKALAAATIGARLYAIAGNRWITASAPYTRVVEAYDTAAQTWSQVTSIPSGRYGHAAVSVGGKIYVFGGRREAGDSTTGIVDVYTPDP